MAIGSLLLLVVPFGSDGLPVCLLKFLCLRAQSKRHCASKVHALSIQSVKVVGSGYIDNNFVARAGCTASMKYSHFAFSSKAASSARVQNSVVNSTAVLLPWMHVLSFRCASCSAVLLMKFFAKSSQNVFQAGNTNVPSSFMAFL